MNIVMPIVAIGVILLPAVLSIRLSFLAWHGHPTTGIGGYFPYTRCYLKLSFFRIFAYVSSVLIVFFSLSAFTMPLFFHDSYGAQYFFWRIIRFPILAHFVALTVYIPLQVERKNLLCFETLYQLTTFSLLILCWFISGMILSSV